MGMFKLGTLKLKLAERMNLVIRESTCNNKYIFQNFISTEIISFLSNLQRSKKILFESIHAHYIKTVPLNFVVNKVCTVLLLCLLRNLMEQTLVHWFHDFYKQTRESVSVCSHKLCDRMDGTQF